jgi:hypothetical protein
VTLAYSVANIADLLNSPSPLTGFLSNAILRVDDFSGLARVCRA